MAVTYEVKVSLEALENNNEDSREQKNIKRKTEKNFSK